MDQIGKGSARMIRSSGLKGSVGPWKRHLGFCRSLDRWHLGGIPRKDDRLNRLSNIVESSAIGGPTGWKRAALSAFSALAIGALGTFASGCTETERHAKELGIHGEITPIVRQLEYDDNARALLEEISYLPEEVQKSEVVLDCLETMSTDKTIGNHELAQFKDLDGDKLINVKEVEYGTNPLSKDSDNDGLGDYEEVLTCETNPLSGDTDGDGLGDGEERNVLSTDLLKQNPNIAYALNKDQPFYTPYIRRLKLFDSDGTMDVNEQWFLDKLPQYLFFIEFSYILSKDGTIDSNEKCFLDLAIQYSEVNEIFPGFYSEIANLPDLSTIEKQDVEALEDILILAADPKYKRQFESMLEEGIPEKRKFCTPLEALLWIAYDKEFDKPSNNPLESFSLGLHCFV